MLKQHRMQVYLAIDACDQSMLVHTLNIGRNDILPWVPHPRTLTDLVRYVSVLKRPDLDLRIACIIRALACSYNILPSGK